MMSLAQLRARVFSKRVGIATVYLGATVLARAGAVLLIPLYTRRLSLPEYGDYALAQTMISLLSTPIALSLHQAVGRFYFGHKDVAASEARTGGAARWLVIVTLVNALALQLLIYALRPADATGLFSRWALSCIVWGSAGASIGQVPAQFLKGAQRPFPAAGFQLTEFFLTVGAGLLMVLVLGRGLRGAIEAAAIAGIANGCIATTFILIRLKGRVTLTLLKEAVRFSLPFIPHAAGNQIQFISDRWVMKATGYEAALGAYSLASQLTAPVSMAVEAWHQASSPQMGETFRAGGIEGMAKRSTAYQRSYLMIALMAGLGLCLALPIAALVVGKSFQRALWLVPFICAIIALESLYHANAVIVFYADKPGSIPKVTIPAGILNVALNAVLVPAMGGIPGALLSRAISMGFRSGGMWWFARQHLKEGVKGAVAARAEA
jgi:O-antigen/teichoic acid export membrane protein